MHKLERLAIYPPLQGVATLATPNRPNERKVYGLGYRQIMDIASLNAKGFLLHIDEIHTITKVLEIHILTINEAKLEGPIADD